MEAWRGQPCYAFAHPWPRMHRRLLRKRDQRAWTSRTSRTSLHQRARRVPCGRFPSSAQSQIEATGSQAPAVHVRHPHASVVVTGSTRIEIGENVSLPMLTTLQP